MATTAYCKTIASDSSATAPSEISTFDSFNSLTHGRLLSWDGFWKTPQELKLLFDLQDARELLGKAARACKPGDPEKETLVARAELARTTYELEWTRQCRECPEEGDVRFEEGRVIEELVVVEKEQIVVVEKDVREAAAIERDAAQLDVDMYRAIGELPDELDKVAQNVVVEASASFNTLEDSNIDVLARHEDLSSNQDDTEKVPKVLMAMLSAAAKADSAAVFDDESNDTACTATLTVVEVEAALKEIASAPEVTVDVHVSKDDFVRVPEMVDMDISNAITNNAKQVQEHDIVGLHMQEVKGGLNNND